MVDKKVMNPCRVCGKEVDEFDAVELDCPEKFAKQHPEAIWVKVWHRRCFEQYFGIKLPPFRYKSHEPRLEKRGILAGTPENRI